MPSSPAFRQSCAPAAVHEIGRLLQGEIAQHIRNGVDLGRIGVVALGIAWAEAGDLGARHALTCLEVLAIRQREEVGQAALDDFQAVAGQIEVADDLRVEEADGVGCDRVAKARVKLIRHGRSSDHGALLDHLHLQARGGEIAGADEAVMPCPDDHHIIAFGHSILLPIHPKTKISASGG